MARAPPADASILTASHKLVASNMRAGAIIGDDPHGGTVAIGAPCRRGVSWDATGTRATREGSGAPTLPTSITGGGSSRVITQEARVEMKVGRIGNQNQGAEVGTSPCAATDLTAKTTERTEENQHAHETNGTKKQQTTKLATKESGHPR